ncbi:MAG TPA: hydroxymethylbilane synthase [bacterium]|nr:hydroxymethylbilane synthase [bacterium]
MRILVGTRGSELALAQAGMVRDLIAPLFPRDEVVLEVVKTLGDRLSAKEAEVGPEGEPPQGVFTKELDEALLEGRVAMAIHSLKDVPTVLPAGIHYGAFLKREDPRDVLVSRDGKRFHELAAGARIGTSSPRREAQVRAARRDLQVVPLRGNVDTRLRKMAQGEMEAVLLAGAGLKRLGRGAEATEWLDPEWMLPAPAQGVLAVTLLERDKEMAEKITELDDVPTRTCAEAERAFLKTLLGGCRIPVGALATLQDGILTLSGVVAQPSGEQVMRGSRKGDPKDPRGLGTELARNLLANGAQEILNGFGRASW